MKRIRTVVILLLGAALSLSLIPLAMAGQPTHTRTQLYEGQIRSVKIDKCGLQPGTCEGSVIVAPQGGGSEVALAIKPGTWIKRGDNLVTIDELGVGNYVKVEATQLPGEPTPRATVLTTPG
jgi:hypothetical protein